MIRTMRSKSKNFLSIALALIMLMVLIPQNVHAATAHEIQNQINNIQGLSASRSGNTVTVTGTRSNYNESLSLDLNNNVRVIWLATLTAGSSLRDPLIEITGSGTFEVGNNGEIAAQDREAIKGSSTSCKIVVSGGLVSSTSNNSNYPVIYLSSSGNTGENLTISGGRVEAKGTTQALSSSGTVKVTGGEVLANQGAAIRLNGSSAKAEVSGGLVFAYGTQIVGTSSSNRNVI
ncbi:MAG TPA: hypothetical protein GXZ59_02825 [Clostridiaceae bacterium]|nr:hypothetical protein [Clostridiaceae bacterium]